LVFPLPIYSAFYVLKSGQLENNGPEDLLITIKYIKINPWHGGLTLFEQMDFERIQRNLAHIILGHRYLSYMEALKTLHRGP
jgi:hypothetical protein